MAVDVTRQYTWGNLNYKSGGDIELKDYDAGRQLLADEPRSVVIMCLCKNPATCHRSTIAAMLQADGYEVSEYTPPRSFTPLMF